MMANRTSQAKNAAIVDRARRLRDRFAKSGYAPVEPAILQPAEVFVGLSGESIRRRLYVVQGASGEDYCLRPDVTIPVARMHAESGKTDETRYCYAGPGFRRAVAGEEEGSGEFQQAGFEIFGSDKPDADTEVLALAIDGLKSEGLSTIRLGLGDPGMFRALIAALDVPEFWRERLVRHFWRRDLASGITAAFENTPDPETGNEAFATALAALDKEAASSLVEEVLALAGIEPVGGRSADEIAHRFMERAALSADPLPKNVVSTIRNYLAIEGAPEDAILRMREIDKDSRLGLGETIDTLGAKLERASTTLKEACGKNGEIVFNTDFGRNLEYYTGLVFELHDIGNPELRQIAGGGRYDKLLAALGAKSEIPAVGCAIYVDRLTRALEGPGA